MDISSEFISMCAGVLLSLAFSYLPGIKEWYDQLTPTPKRTVMLLALLIVTIGLLGWNCALVGSCYARSLPGALQAYLFALLANQATFLASPINPQRRMVRDQARLKNATK